MDHSQLLDDLRQIVGRRYVVTGAAKTLSFRRPYRGADGPALCVVQPGSLIELWRVIQACVTADVVIVMQAANTGLTGGSTPIEIPDRKSVLVNTLRLTGVQYLENTNQVVALPGTSLFDVEQVLKGHDRSPHSVIGSSCFGASVVGGICNNSGGALVHRGPAYTELSLFAHLREDGTLALVNHLDIDLGESPEDILHRLETGNFTADDVHVTNRKGAATDYETAVRAVDQDSPARYNADPSRLYESSGSAGKIAVFAVRVDSFTAPKAQDVVLVASKSPEAFTRLRRAILTDTADLPISAEYMHTKTMDLGLDYGRDAIRIIQWFGTSKLGVFFKLKRLVDGYMEQFGLGTLALTDRLLQIFGRLTPHPFALPLRQWTQPFEHYLIVTTNGPADDFIDRINGYGLADEIACYACDPKEAQMVSLVRYAAAAAAVRYAAVHPKTTEGVLALDIALKRNDPDWLERLPDDIQNDLVESYYYGHFLCNVFHQDYIVRKGADIEALKDRILEQIAARGGVYPAEHNVGHQYEAASTLQQHYRTLDPKNVFNAGIGKMSTAKDYEHKTRVSSY